MATLYIIMNLLLLWFGVVNHNNYNGQLVLAGVTSNFLVASVNNGKIPTYGQGIIGKYSLHSINPKNANLSFLGDWINIPLNTSGNVIIISPGDIVTTIGLIGYLYDQFILK